MTGAAKTALWAGMPLKNIKMAHVQRTGNHVGLFLLPMYPAWGTLEYCTPIVLQDHVAQVDA